VEGIYTTIPLHRRILADPDFRAGRIDTTFISRLLGKGGPAGANKSDDKSEQRA